MDITEQGTREAPTLDIRQWLLSFKLRYKVLSIVAVVLMLITLLVVLLWPSTYRSVGTILIEQQEVPQDFVRSSVTSFAAERIHIIKQKVMTTENLLRIINKFDLYADLREKEPREVIIHKLSQGIGQEVISADVVDPRSGRPVQATIAFQVSFSHSSPRVAQQVANEIATLYLGENIKQRTAMADQTRSFLSSEAQKLKTTIVDFEQQIAQFKSENFSALPEQTDINIRLLDRTDQDIADISRRLQSLREREIYLKNKLLSVSAHSPTFADTGERVLSPAARLKFLQSRYISQSSVYSGEHPTIIRILKEIDALRAEYGEVDSLLLINKQLIATQTRLAEAAANYSPDHPEIIQLNKVHRELQDELETALGATELHQDGQASIVGADNPAYLQLMSDLELSRSEIRALETRRVELGDSFLSYQGRLDSAPEIERQYRDLLREHEQARLMYMDVRSKELSAGLSRSLEMEQKGERFTLIEPPLQPQQPISPNRPAILVLGFILAFGSAAGLGLLLENSDKSVKGRAELFALTGEPPLAVVPYISTKEELAGHKSQYIKLLGIVIGLGFVGLIAIHTLYRPLDILFFVVLRKLGFN